MGRSILSATITADVKKATSSRAARRTAITLQTTVEIRDPAALVEVAKEMAYGGTALAASATTRPAAIVVTGSAAAAAVINLKGAAAAARRSRIDEKHRGQDRCAK